MKKIILVALAAVSVLLSSLTASADTVIGEEDTSYDRYIAFGQDLSQKEKKAVLDAFGMVEADVENFS